MMNKGGTGFSKSSATERNTLGYLISSSLPAFQAKLCSLSSSLDFDLKTTGLPTPVPII
ncbi:MAG: hypothetical protein HYR56_26485 [Acidobacteria bacterium]|nr:hypothetical protein [Acidobacteriota bacterium]